jgi:snapalysin
MSGSSAGVSCTNPYPNAAERAEVEDNFAFALTNSVSSTRPLLTVD